MKIGQLFIEGGIHWMIAITVSGVAMLFFSLLKTIQMVKNHKYDFQYLNYILLFGSLSFILGILGLGLGISQMMQIIHQVGDISPSLVAGGFHVALITPIYGTIIFTISLLFWGILKEINLKKTM